MGENRTGRVLLLGGVAVYAAALLTVFLTGNAGVRYTADHDDTRPLWLVWIPVLAGFLVAWLLPPKNPAPDPFAGTEPRKTTSQAWSLAGLAVAFAVGYYLSPRGDLWFVGLKWLLLLMIPLVLVKVTWREWSTVDLRGRWLRPLLAVAVYIGLVSTLTPWTGSSAPDLLVVLFVFLANSFLEEVFYRFWLQTRLESRYGRWPAILLSSLLWASWHVAIQGGDTLPIDLASVVVNQGVTGIFLGYLWSLHRNPWALVLAHGLVNAPIGMIIAMV